MAASVPAIHEIIAAGTFALAVLHTFSTRLFAHLAHRQPAHAGLWHLLGEVEVVFGFWALVLMLVWLTLADGTAVLSYIETRDFTEPMFVFVIMVMAATRPVLALVKGLVIRIAQSLPINTALASFFLCLAGIPLLGSFITEPAAMTVAALLLRDYFFNRGLSKSLQYATLGVLFVNVSIGGTLTSFAAPPVLMVAKQWGWDSLYMLTHFGWRSAVAVAINTLIVAYAFRHEIVAKSAQSEANTERMTGDIPLTVVAIHIVFLGGVVLFAHHSVVFMAIFLFFLGYTEAYRAHQDRLYLREGLLVAFFLAGLVTLGGLQKWWIQPLLSGVDDTTLYFVATALTAVTDNAALTYLGSLVDGVSEGYKYALVAGAVTGGGLTVIANAPNPAGFAILKASFQDGAINPFRLFIAALLPTCVAIAAFMVL
jgi:Na+/H+ antiporter NhaD/arsenite permease-like protein